MHTDIQQYHERISGIEREICHILAGTIESCLTEAHSRIWHGHPVWFLENNPVVGYSKVKAGIKLLFWSGQTFDEAGLISSGSFKASEIIYTSTDQINSGDLKRWLEKSREIQWDYKNIVKRKGVLERLR